MQDGDNDTLDVSSTTRTYQLTDSALGGYGADGSSFPFASASSLNSALFSSSDSNSMLAASGALPALLQPEGAMDMSTTVIIYEDAEEAAAGDAEAVQPSSQVPVAFPTWDEELDFTGSQHISVTSTGFIPVSIAYSATGSAQPQQLQQQPAAAAAATSPVSSPSNGLSSTLRSPPPLPELPSPSAFPTLPSPTAPVPASTAWPSASLLHRGTPSPPPPPPRPSESAVAEEQRRALQPPPRHSPGLPPLPPSALSAARRTPPSPLSPHPLAQQHAVNGSSATTAAAISFLSSSSSSSFLSSSSASGLRRGGGSLRTASFEVLRYLQSDLHRGELCWLWAGDRQPLERRRQFVFWEPPDDADTGGRQQLGSLHWCDAAGLGQQQQRLLLPERQFLLHDVSDVYVSNLSGCPNSPFFLSPGQPAAGVSLPCCLSLLVSESFGFHLQLDSVAQREAWVMEFLALLHERKYITETASLAFSSAAAGTTSAPLTPVSASLTPSQRQDSDSGSSAPPAVTSTALGSLLYSGTAVSEQPLIASDSVICECAHRALLVSAGDVVVQMDDMDGSFQTRRIQSLPNDGSQLTAMCCHSSCLFQCRRHPSGRNELIAIPIAADEWRPEALSSVDIGPTTGSHCANSGDGRLVYVAAGSTVLRVADMQRVERLEAPQPARGSSAVELGNLALSPDDSALFSLDLADPAGSLWWWNVSTGQCRKLLLGAVVSSPRSIAFIAGTCHLLLVNADARVQLLDLTAVIRSPTAATPTLRRIPLDMADVRHCMIGGFSLLSADEAASGAYTAEDRKRPVLIASAVDSTQGLTTFILPLRGALGIRRWRLVAERRNGGGSSSNLASSPTASRAASTSPRHANGAAVAAAPLLQVPRLALGSSCRLKQLEGCRVFCSFVDPSIHFLLLHAPKKRCLLAFNCRTEQLHKLADRLQEEVCALCYEPVRERLYVCWPNRLSHFTIRKADWPELVERKTLQLSGGTTLAHLSGRPVSCVCDRAGESVYVSLSVRVVRVSAAGAGIQKDFSVLGSLVCDPSMTDLALSHGDRQLLALDSATRRVWRWEISSGQCLNRLTDRAYLSMDRSEASPPACRLSVAHPNSGIILLADTAAQLRVFSAPPFDPSQPQQCTELMRISLQTSVEPSSRSWRLTSPFSSPAADEDGGGGSQALIAPDALFARSMRDESISVVAVQSGLRLISQFRREEQQPT